MLCYVGLLKKYLEVILIYQYFFFRDFVFPFEKFNPLHSNTNSDYDPHKIPQNSHKNCPKVPSEFP